jgi:hypothetical protein
MNFNFVSKRKILFNFSIQNMICNPIDKYMLSKRKGSVIKCTSPANVYYKIL